ncbi:MAG TPA: translation initiation factor IF-2 [Candidatus Saccharibacteria bacterium]|nr:translation initiation factor IF-2 [Candidatus Saccharibacteria bacterium]
MSEKVILVADSITVGELAEKLNLPVTKLIGELFKNGIMATINQRIDFETAVIIVEELGLSDVELKKKEKAIFAERKEHELSNLATPRPPIVAVMGHVDHGKTTLLDAILKTKVAEGEAGGITQYISAYQTVHKGQSITLLDTPGHEAFASLRQHGAALTDLVIIVVAADDGVKPQTAEAIQFAKSANAKIIVAINKIDRPGADPARVKAQLATDYGLNPEEWGGDTIMIEISAKTGQNVDKLLDMVLLIADMEELRADINTPAEGLVIESHMEVGRGPVVGILIQHGILKPGHSFVAGTVYGKVRTLLDFNGKTLKEAGPSTPVTVTGFKELPKFGNSFIVVSNEKEARHQTSIAKMEMEKNAASTNITGSDLLKMMSQKSESQELNVIVKADVQGSLTSVVNSLKIIDTQGEITLNIINSGVGDINESDIRLAIDQNTIIYGFNINMSNAVKQMATRNKIQIRIFDVIYKLLDDARSSMEEILSPEVKEIEVGNLIIKGVFRTLRDEIITGGEVTKGKISSGLLARVIRRTTNGKEQIGEVKVNKVQRQQQEAKEVFEGEMCGLSLKTEKKLIIEEGDKLEFFTRELVKRTLK